MKRKTAQSARRRAAAGIAEVTHWRGQQLSPLTPYSMTLLAEAGQLEALMGYDLSSYGARPLWHAIVCHIDPDAYAAAIGRGDVAQLAEAEGKGWTMPDLARASRWLNGQGDHIQASMVEVEEDGEPGKPVTSRTA